MKRTPSRFVAAPNGQKTAVKMDRYHYWDNFSKCAEDFRTFLCDWSGINIMFNDEKHPHREAEYLEACIFSVYISVSIQSCANLFSILADKTTSFSYSET